MITPDYITIPLTKGQETIVDPIDADLAELKWYAFDNGHDTYYAARDSSRKNSAPKKTIFLHQIIMGRILKRELLDNRVPDHIDGNTLNNARDNLREATISQNGMNSKTRIDNSSGVKGVGWCKREKKWRAYIYIEKRFCSLGYFNVLEDAVLARKTAEQAYYGEFSR